MSDTPNPRIRFLLFAENDCRDGELWDRLIKGKYATADEARAEADTRNRGCGPYSYDEIYDTWTGETLQIFP